jgi:hypothetical protein
MSTQRKVEKNTTQDGKQTQGTKSVASVTTPTLPSYLKSMLVKPGSDEKDVVYVNCRFYKVALEVTFGIRVGEEVVEMTTREFEDHKMVVARRLKTEAEARAREGYAKKLESRLLIKTNLTDSELENAIATRTEGFIGEMLGMSQKMFSERYTSFHVLVDELAKKKQDTLDKIEQLAALHLDGEWRERLDSLAKESAARKAKQAQKEKPTGPKTLSEPPNANDVVTETNPKPNLQLGQGKPPNQKKEDNKNPAPTEEELVKFYKSLKDYGNPSIAPENRVRIKKWLKDFHVARPSFIFDGNRGNIDDYGQLMKE